MPSLLTPIRSLEGAIRVIRAGTDEIYCGVDIPGYKNFSLYRGTSCNIHTYDELGRIVTHAHKHNVDVLATINEPYITNHIEKDMRNHIRTCVNMGVDALIIGDVGVLSLVKEMDVDVMLYASTYMAAMNIAAIQFLSDLGFNRVILERQLTIPEISEMAKQSNVEVEIFIHGSGCSHLNVGCFLYHFVYPTMTHALLTIDGIKNRCSFPFEIYDLDNPTTKIDDQPILDAGRFCSICHLPELINSGVTGFKIVGRCIDEEYQASTVKMYRELMTLINRGEFETFQQRIAALKNNFIPLQRDLPMLNLNELCCEQQRCYYSPLFHAPYKTPITWQTWTKHQFKFIQEVTQ
jgi:putative protease